VLNRQNDVSGALADADRAQQFFADIISKEPNSLEYRAASIGAELEHGQIYSLNNRYSEAIPQFREALAALNSMDQGDRQVRLLTAKGHAFLGNALSWDGQQPEAESEIGAALAITEKIGSDFPNDSEIQSSVWQIYSTASSVFEDSQKDYSLELAQKALMVASKAAEADKADSQARYDLARAFSRVGIMFAKLDRLPDAVANLLRSERIFSELIEREPKNVIYQRDLGKLYVRMGDTSEKRRDIPDALLKFQNSAVIFEKIASSDERNTLALRDLAQSLRSVGKMEIALGLVSNAKINLRRALEILERLTRQNALGAYDKQLIDDVEKTLGSI
jgi:tetratricopeptide (TPR) repeat protein